MPLAQDEAIPIGIVGILRVVLQVPAKEEARKQFHTREGAGRMPGTRLGGLRDDVLADGSADAIQFALRPGLDTSHVQPPWLRYLSWHRA